jgi:ribose transport system substrate-binding protein
MNKSFPKVLVLVAVLSVLAGVRYAAGQESQLGVAAAPKYTFAFVPGIATNPFYITMHYGAQQAAKELNVELLWQGPQNWDFAEQTVIVESLLARGVDAMLISPTDPVAMMAPLRRAVQDGVLVITTDTDIDDPDRRIRPLAIASDNHLGGQKAGEALAEAIGGRGEVALMGAMVGVTTNEQRYAGFRDALAGHQDIRIVATEYSEEDQSRAAQQMESVLLAHPNLAGAFAVDTPTAHGAAVGLRNAGKAGEVVLVGFDAQPLEIEDLKNGITTMLVAQAPYAMGYLAVQNAYNYLEGLVGELPPELTTGFYIITQENVDDPETQKWVYQTESPR